VVNSGRGETVGMAVRARGSAFQYRAMTFPMVPQS